MVTLQDGSPSICLPKAMALCQKTGAVCENQLISSHRFVERLKYCLHIKLRNTVRTPADEEDGSKKIASSTEGAVFGGQMPGGPDGSPFMA